MKETYKWKLCAGKWEDRSLKPFAEKREQQKSSVYYNVMQVM